MDKAVHCCPLFLYSDMPPTILYITYNNLIPIYAAELTLTDRISFSSQMSGFKKADRCWDSISVTTDFISSAGHATAAHKDFPGISYQDKYPSTNRISAWKEKKKEPANCWAAFIQVDPPDSAVHSHQWVIKMLGIIDIQVLSSKSFPFSFDSKSSRLPQLVLSTLHQIPAIHHHIHHCPFKIPRVLFMLK